MATREGGGDHLLVVGVGSQAYGIAAASHPINDGDVVSSELDVANAEMAMLQVLCSLAPTVVAAATSGDRIFSGLCSAGWDFATYSFFTTPSDPK
jgi:hypothetical protein